MVAVANAWIKDPSDTQRYGLDWTSCLADAGLGVGSVLGCDVIVPAGLTLLQSEQDGAISAAWIGGGAVGSSYLVTYRLRVENPSGAGDPITWDRSIRITVAER